MEGEYRSERPVPPVWEQTLQTMVLKIGVVRRRSIIAFEQVERIVALARRDVGAIIVVAMVGVAGMVAVVLPGGGTGRSLAGGMPAVSAAYG
jgi:hypothetical protein